MFQLITLMYVKKFLDSFVFCFFFDIAFKTMLLPLRIYKIVFEKLNGPCLFSFPNFNRNHAITFSCEG